MFKSETVQLVKLTCAKLNSIKDTQKYWMVLGTKTDIGTDRQTQCRRKDTKHHDRWFQGLPNKKDVI